jgi:hypothetical protein
MREAVVCFAFEDDTQTQALKAQRRFLAVHRV